MDDLELELARVETALEREEFDGALAALNSIRERFPGFRERPSVAPLVDLYEGQAIFRKEMQGRRSRGRLLKAKEYLDRSLAANPEFAAAHWLAGMLSMVLASSMRSRGTLYFDFRARHHLEKAEALDPRFASVPGMHLPVVELRLRDSCSVILCSKSDEMIGEWEAEFAQFPWVRIVKGDILQQKASAVVSPANSFGFMDGGLDHQLSEHFGLGLQERLRDVIQARFLGEIPVGQAAVVETGHGEIPYLVSAPTMRVPMEIRDTANPYLATRAAFLAVEEFNSVERRIESVLMPSMGTGVGAVPYGVAARQMRAAYEDIVLRANVYPQDVEQAIDRHRALSTEHYHRMYRGERYRAGFLRRARPPHPTGADPDGDASDGRAGSPGGPPSPLR